MASRSTEGSPILSWHTLCSPALPCSESGVSKLWSVSSGGGRMEQHHPSQAQQPPQHQDRQPGIESAMTPRPKAGSRTWPLRINPPLSKASKMPPYHTMMRGYRHDFAPYLLPTRDSGTPVVMHPAILSRAKPRRGVTSGAGRTRAPSAQAQAVQRTRSFRGPHPTTSLRRV